MNYNTKPLEFKEGYNEPVIPLPVKLPRLFNYDAEHESYVTVIKLSQMYQTLYSFIDEGDQTLVPTPVSLPVMHDFTKYNKEFVTVATLQALYKCLYEMDPKVTTLKKTPGAAAAFLMDHADYYMNDQTFIEGLRGTYGWDGTQGLSLVTYIEMMLSPQAWGDELCLYILAHMWGVGITLLYPSENNRQHMIRTQHAFVTSAFCFVVHWAFSLQSNR